MKANSIICGTTVDFIRTPKNRGCYADPLLCDTGCSFNHIIYKAKGYAIIFIMLRIEKANSQYPYHKFGRGFLLWHQQYKDNLVYLIYYFCYQSLNESLYSLPFCHIALQGIYLTLSI